MASIRRRNGKYQVQIRLGSYSRSHSFHKLIDAKSWARCEEEFAQQRRFLGNKYEPKNLAEILNRYLNEITPRNRSCGTERIVLNALLKEDWVNTSLPRLNVAAIAEYRDRRLVAVKPATLRRQLNIVKHACGTAEREWDWLSPLSLFHRVTLPKNIEHVVKRITAADEQALIKIAQQSRTKNLPQLIILAIETGMRREELLALTWDDVDLDRHELLVRQSKNGKPRKIPLTRRAHSTFVSITTSSREVVFPLSGNAVRLAFERIKKHAGLEHIRFHDLRHEATSRFFDLGLTYPEVAALTGHCDYRVLRSYAHENRQLLFSKLVNNL